MSDHSLYFSPSAAHRWLRCTASARLCAQVEDKGSKYAAEGTAAHWLFEQHMRARLEKRPWGDSVRQTYLAIAGNDDIVLEKSMIEPVQMAANYVLDQQLDGFMAETKLLIPPTDSFGTADIIGWKGSEVHIMDLKYGKSPRGMVDAYENPQLMLYALGAIDLLPLLMKDDPTLVVLHIMQPRLEHYSQYTLSVHILNDWAEYQVQPAVKAIHDDAGQYQPSEHACQWCKVKATCQAHHEFVAVPFETLFEDLDGDITDAAEWSLADVMDKAQMLESYLKQVRGEVRDRLLKGDTVRGYKLVPGRKTRKWKDESQVQLQAGIENLHIDDVAPRALLSPAKMEKELTGFYASIEHLVEKVPGKPTVAPEADPRPEWTGPELDFEDLGE
jgi:hypothetical protein